MNAQQQSELAASIATLTVEIRGQRVDITAVQREVDELRSELRGELTAVRSDLALITSRQNSAIGDNKKKLPDWATALSVFTGD